MTGPSAQTRIADAGVVPVIAIETVDAALPLVDALAAGGLPVVEITFRTKVAADVIARICQERPDMLVGAGTILTSENLAAAHQAGAKFGVAPGLNPEILAEAQDLGLPFMPGVATASDIECALSMGCQQLKFFPAEPLGGVKMLKALAAPYAHTGVQFVPLGGLNVHHVEDYLRLPSVSAVGGSWIAKREDILAGNWVEVQQRCREACDCVRRVRQN